VSVKRHGITFLKNLFADAAAPAVVPHCQFPTADNTDLVELPGNNGSVRRSTAACREDSRRCGQSGDVRSRAVGANQDGGPAGVSQLHRLLRVKYRDSDRDARAGSDSTANWPAPLGRHQSHVSNCPQIILRQPPQCCPLINQPLSDLFTGNPKRRPCRALGIACLEQVETSFLYRKLEVLRIVKQKFQPVLDAAQLTVEFRQTSSTRRSWMR
jgi:hypothetical protein